LTPWFLKMTQFYCKVAPVPFAIFWNEHWKQFTCSVLWQQNGQYLISLPRQHAVKFFTQKSRCSKAGLQITVKILGATWSPNFTNITIPH
jgi:hypothetical protein